MNLFKIHDPETWLSNKCGFPMLSVISKDGETIYAGRRPADYFEIFSIQFYQEYEIFLWLSEGTHINLGEIKKLNKIPEVKVMIDL